MEKLNQLKEMLTIQGEEGNWNYDSYMHGMFNGMEYAVSLLEGREPEYRLAPPAWLADKEPKIIPAESVSEEI